MSPSRSPTFLEICAALRIKRGHEFEVLCNDYLKALYPNLTPQISTKAEWTRPGTPDAFILDEQGNLIACQYGGSQEEWHRKLLADAEKVKKLATEGGLTITKLLFCTTAEISSLGERADAEREVKHQYGFPVELYDLTRLASDLETRYPGIAVRRLGLTIRLKHFMSLDTYLDSPNQRYWPKRRDVEEGKLHWPENYIEEIEEKFLERKRCMLTGISGSGKTALAIAFGLWWHENEENMRRHPEAVVFYLEARPGYSEEMGEDWYREVLGHDHQNELFLIDNCHLASAAVNAFCYQLERKQPEQALVLLISAPKVSWSPWEVDPQDYFDDFERTGTIVKVEPEQIYKGMLRACNDAYRRIAPKYFVPVDTDLGDPDCAQKLERLCAHNLIEARSLLEAWGNIGGRLSDVTEEAALDGLGRRHLTQHKVPALIPLCGLAQFEITAHQDFVNQLPQESIGLIRRENLITPEDTLFYGRCYQLLFHPQTAARLFQAYVRQRVGAGYKSRVEDEIFLHLKTYLSSRPGNFTEVYYHLYRVGAIELQNCLLGDPELQTYARQRFATSSLNDVVWYLYALHRIRPTIAISLLEDFFSQMTEEVLQKQMLGLSGLQFSIVSSYLPKMSLDVAHIALGNLPAEWVAKQLTFANLSSINHWISPASSFLAVKLGYSEAWRQQVANALDINVLADRVQKANPQAFVWFLDSFTRIAKEQARLFVDRVSLETLGQRMSGQSFPVIKRTLNLLRKLGYKPASCSRVVNALDLTSLLAQIKEASLQNIYWLLRDLKSATPELVESVLTHVTSTGLAKMFRVQEATINDLSHFDKVCSRAFMKDVLKELGDEEIVAIFKRSKLGEIGTLMEWQFHRFEQIYAIFATESLTDKLATETINEVGKFITRLQRVPQEGQRLVVQALEHLLETSLSIRVTETDVEQLALLLLNVHSVDPIYPERILAALAPSKSVEKALQHSGVRGIQLLLHSLSEVASTFLPSIGQSLRSVDLTARIAEAEIKDLGHLLWNVSANVGSELAETYCQTVDAQLRSDQIAKAELTELAAFLWNLVHISGAEDLKTLNKPAFQERLRKEWESHPGSYAQILGILEVVRPKAIEDFYLPVLNIDRMSGILTEWLAGLVSGRHPHAFALTTKGLQALDRRRTIEIVRDAIRQESIVDECFELLHEAIEQCVTPRSRAVLEEAIRLVQEARSV